MSDRKPWCCLSSWRRECQDLRHDAANFSGRVELPFALAALGREVAHQVFVGVAEYVVAVGFVLGEVQSLVFENGDQVSKLTQLPELLPDALDPMHYNALCNPEVANNSDEPVQWFDPPSRAVLERADALLFRHRPDLERPSRFGRCLVDWE